MTIYTQIKFLKDKWTIESAKEYINKNYSVLNKNIWAVERVSNIRVKWDKELSNKVAKGVFSENIKKLNNNDKITFIE